MTSKYGIGTISDMLAKEAGGGAKQRPDAKLAAFFGGGTSTAKVFKTVAVKGEKFFKSTVVSSFSKPDIVGGAAAEKKLKKKKKEVDVKLKNKNAAAIRKKVKGRQNEDVVAPVPLRGLPGVVVKQEKKKPKKNKKRSKKVTAKEEVQDETISSTTTIVNIYNNVNVNITSDGKKLKDKKEKKLDKKKSGISADKPQGNVKGKKSQNVNDSESPKKKSKKQKKLKLQAKSAEPVEGNKVTVKKEDESEMEDEDEDQQEPEDVKPIVDKSGEISAADLKTIAEKNAPKEKDPELESRTIFVGNVPGDTDKKTIMKLFNKFGTIDTIRFRGGAPTKPSQLKKVAVIKKELHADKNTLSAYIRFETKEEAEIAVNEGRGMMINENHLVLDLADQGKNKDNKKAIFVGNLNLKLTDEELWRFFEDCGTIVSVRIIRDNATGMGKGFGYVNFENKEGVVAALQKNQQDLGNRTVRISRCVKKLKVKKGAQKPGGKGSRGRGAPGKGRPWKQMSEDSKEYGGDRLAEIGKLKRKSNKPNRGELHKAKIVKLLAGTKPATPATQGTSKKKFFHTAATKPQGRQRPSRNFNKNR